jgi:hypothetical protein
MLFILTELINWRIWCTMQLVQVTAQGFVLTCSATVKGEGVTVQLGTLLCLFTVYTHLAITCSCA